MKIEKQELQNALETVKPGLANKEIIDQSTSFAFLEDRIVTFNDIISISYPIKTGVTGVIRAEELYGFLKQSSSKEISLELKENELRIKSGRSKVGLSVQSDIMLPLDEVGKIDRDWEDLPEDFSHDLMFVRGSASKDMSRVMLTCVHVTETGVEASDGYQIMRLEKEGWPLGNILVPADAASEIHKIEPAQVAKSEGWIHFRNQNGTQLSCRILVEQYPDTSKHLSVKGERIELPKELTETLNRVTVFTKKDHFMDEEMSVDIKGGKLTVHGKNDYGWFKEQLSISYEGETSFGITPSLLQNILKRSNVCFLGEEKIKFEGDNWVYVAVLRN